MAPRETPLSARTLVKAGAAALVAVSLLPDDWASALRPFMAGGYSVGFWLSQAALLALLGLLAPLAPVALLRRPTVRARPRKGGCRPPRSAVPRP